MDRYDRLTLAIGGARTLAGMASLCVDNVVEYPHADDYLRGQLNSIASVLLMIGRILENPDEYEEWLMDEKAQEAA